MKHITTIVCAAGIFSLSALTALAQVDTTYVSGGLRVYEMLPLSVVAQRANLGVSEASMSRDFVQDALEKAGIDFIRRGVFLATDVSFDGFRGGDIEIVIDGERSPNSCPNRMDPPLSRVNPLEMESVEVNRSSIGLQSGIGGSVEFHRSTPSRTALLRSGVSTTAGAAETVDAGFSAEAENIRLTGRFLRGTPYTDGDGQSFSDLYGYRRDAPYGLYESSLHYKRGPIAIGASYSYTEDIPFPYLHMDERFNKLFSGSVSYNGTKVYANRTHHLMDLGLRTQSDIMQVETDVTNLTIGLTNDFAELYYRQWDGWNNRQKPDGSMRAEQHMIPESTTISASARHQIPVGNVIFSGRLGFQRQGFSDESRLGFYQPLYPEAAMDRWFVPFALVAQYSDLLTENISAGFEAEVGSRAPLLEEMYVALQRPGDKPRWLGNPTLDAPVRTSLRTAFSSTFWRAELFGAHIFRYPALSRTDLSDAKFVSYTGVRALMSGFNVQLYNRYSEIAASYTFGQNLTAKHPLPEILPLTGSARVILPEHRGLSGHFGITAAAAQGRVAELLNEDRTSGWYRFDAALSYKTDVVSFSANIDNILNRAYAQHLSYVRDPYSAGLKINEPGRLIRLSVQLELN